jgi:hypothetical protein
MPQQALLHKRAVMHAAYPDLSYGPMLQRDQERIANLNWIYNRNDVEAVQMLRMRRAPFYVKGICPRGNNKVVIIIFHVYDKCLFLMLELY